MDYVMPVISVLLAVPFIYYITAYAHIDHSKYSTDNVFGVCLLLLLVIVAHMVDPIVAHFAAVSAALLAVAAARRGRGEQFHGGEPFQGGYLSMEHPDWEARERRGGRVWRQGPAGIERPYA